MCGIIGYIGRHPATPILLDGLKRLEYRGYDSAGIAVLEQGGDFAIEKRAGKLEVLAEALNGHRPSGTIGMGHTRWATHGRPNDVNAHPHQDCTGNVVIIHNGIVENYLRLKSRLLDTGHLFRSETDSEVLAHLVEEHLREGNALEESVRLMLAEIHGAHAIVVMTRSEPGKIVGVRVGNAGGVVVGRGADNEVYLASDLPAILPHTRDVVFLADSQIAVLTAERTWYIDAQGNALDLAPQRVPYDPVAAQKGSYKHFMLKEIMEQPQSLTDTIRERVQLDPPAVVLDTVSLSDEQIAAIRRVLLVGMGTSLHAAMVGRLYMEQVAGIPAEFDNASELRYRQPILGPDTLIVAVTQSGETVDTLAAMEEGRRHGTPQITITNVVGSEASRVADGFIHTRCGPEIGVASTKTYTASIAALYLLACWLGQRRGVVDEERMRGLLADLNRLPLLAGRVLQADPEIEQIALQYHRTEDFLFLGRGFQYPVAMEGALKLKEISYIHAEGYPAGEMKHGPIALIDESMPVVALAPADDIAEKMLSNIEEVKSRSGVVIALATEGERRLEGIADTTFFVPEISPMLAPILFSIPLQLLAYHIAVRRGTDVDQPRNLAKTVTVE